MIRSVTSIKFDPRSGQYDEDTQIKLDLFNPYEASEYLALTDVTNTGPIKSDISVDNWAVVPGGPYNTSHRPYRNIVLSMLYLNDNIEANRLLTYKYFPVESQVRLTFETDTRKYYIDGRIESNDVPMWTDQEGSKVSIICPEPFFYGTDEDAYNFRKVKPLFHFKAKDLEHRPGIFPSDTYIPPVAFGKIYGVNKIVVNNPSRQDVGMLINLTTRGKVTDAKFINLTTNEGLYLKGDVESGTELLINTRVGHKSIVYSDGTNAINKLNINSKWIQLIPGDNVISVGARSGSAAMDVKIFVRPIYEGI